MIPAGLALVLWLTAAIFGALVVHERGVNEAMRSWPAVQATVTSAGLSTFRNSSESRDELRDITTFRYIVNARPHEFTHVEYVGGASSPHRDARYATGQIVTLYVNPLDPTDTSSVANEPGPLLSSR